MTALGTSGRDRKGAIQRLSQAAERVSSRLWLRGDELEAINQRAVIDHHCGLTQSVHGIGPKHSRTAGSMLMMLVEEQSTT